MKQALLIGCGNIGFRHLQALSGIDVEKLPLAITVVEPNQSAHEQLTEYLTKHGRTTGIRHHVMTSIPKDRTVFDLAIIATNAATRRAAFEAMIRYHDVHTIVFEKVLFPTLGDLDAVAAQLKTNAIAAYVNCGRRTAPGYQDLRDNLASGPVNIEVSGTAYGLGSNAIHFLDLAEYLNRARMTGLDASALHPGLTPSKREGYVEIFGTITAHLDNGAQLTLRCDEGSSPYVDLRLHADGRDIAIAETRLEIRNPASASAQPFTIRHVSELTETYVGLLTSGECPLTLYHDSVRQHQFLINGLLTHFGLPQTSDSICPIS